MTCLTSSRRSIGSILFIYHRFEGNLIQAEICHQRLESSILFFELFEPL